MNDHISKPIVVDKWFYTFSIRRISADAGRIALHPLTLLLLAFFCNTLLWAYIVEPGRAPDEWDHFDYIRHLVDTQKLPIYGLTPRFDNPLYALNSESQQPPLYYILAIPFYLLGGQTPAARVVAVRVCS